MSSPGRSMPGAFISERQRNEHALPPKLDVNVGAKSHIFQPPASSSASSSLHRSTTRGSSRSLRGRSSGQKRQRGEDEVRTPGSVPGGSWPVDPTFSANSMVVDSPLPLASTKYRLHEGLDTPTAMANAIFENYERSSVDLFGRRQFDASSPRRVHDLDTLRSERNGVARTGASAGSSPDGRWSQSIFHMVGGIAGKVWQFCRPGAFKGFHAGKGPGFEMRQSQDGVSSSTWLDEDDGKVFEWEKISTRNSIPGQFPEYLSEDDDWTDVAQNRPAKRIQRDKGEGELRKDWVMIPPANTPPHLRETSTSRKNTFKQSPSSASRRQYHTSPANRTTRSRASEVSCGRSPAGRGVRAAGASIASTRSPPTSPRRTANANEVDPQRYVAKKRREEKQVNASMQRFNDHLQYMIREGKEALGSTVEIEDGEDAMDTNEKYGRERIGSRS